MNRLTPDGLAIDAMIPQCLDDQYIPDELLQEMLSAGSSFNDAYINAQRAKAKKREYIRSLIYSSQVVINRLFLCGDVCLIRLYEDPEEQAAMIHLLKEGAIIPYLFSEWSLEADYNQTSNPIKSVMKLLDNLHGSYTALRFAWDDPRNEAMKERMSIAFQTRVSGLYGEVARDNLRDLVLKEVFQSSRNGMSNETITQFQEITRRVSDYAHHTFNVTRTDVYREFFIDRTRFSGNIQVNTGVFVPELQELPLLGAKKLVDLCYNYNLADLLRINMFTPVGFPTSNLVPVNFARTTIDFDADEIAKHYSEIGTQCVIDMQEVMDLPLYEAYTLQDVLAVRAFDEWHEFIKAQQAILHDPKHVTDLFRNYQETLLNLHKRIAQYAKEQPHLLDALLRDVFTFASISIKIGDLLLILGLNGHFQIGGMDLIDLIRNPAFRLISLVGKTMSVYLTNAVASIRDRRLNKILSHNTQLVLSKTIEDVEQLAFLKNYADSITENDGLSDSGENAAEINSNCE